MKAKISVAFIVFVLLYTAVLGKAFYIQILKRDKLIAYSESQLIRKTKIYPKRGFILDRNGHPLAINVQKYNLFTFAKNINKLKADLEKLTKVVKSLPARKILKKAASRNKFTWIARDIELSKQQVSKIQKLKTVVLESRSSRFYPNHELLAQTLGFVGVDNNGLAGVEYQFNDRLKGKPVIHKYFKDAKGRPIKFKSANFDKRADDITLSIDKDIQADLEEYLKEGIQKAQAEGGGAAVMDATTGEVLAIANYPAYDPNRKKGHRNQKLAFVTDPFEPGSIFKSLTVASALEHNIVKPDTNYYCEGGRFKVGNHFIKESDNDHAFEWLSVADILKYSSNVGTTKIAFDLTYPHLMKTLAKFRIGKRTGLEIPGESRGIIDKKENVSPLRLSNMSFGQGVATTGVQMLASYAAFANGGYYVKPTLLKSKAQKEMDRERIISKETAEAMQNMLVEAVASGTGSNAKIKRFVIGGKTSTAQRVNPQGRGYAGYIAGFIGFPVNVDKKFVTYVYVDNPKKGYYGNTVAAPIFQKIVSSILYKTKDIHRLDLKFDKEKESVDLLNIKLSAQRKVKAGEVPNLLGLDKISVRGILKSFNVDYDLKGFGIASKQTPSAGQVLKKGTQIQIEFTPPTYE